MSWSLNKKKFGTYENPDALLQGSVEWGGGHFEWSDSNASLVSMFLRKVMQKRAPDIAALHGQTKLNFIDKTSGSLMMPYYAANAASDPTFYKPQPYNDFVASGKDPLQAFWYLDQDMANYAKNYTVSDKVPPKTLQKTAFLTPGTSNIAPLSNAINSLGTVAMNADGKTANIYGTYYDAIPSPLPNAGTALGHASTSVCVRPITGQFVQTNVNTFKPKMNKLGYAGNPTSYSGCLSAYNYGDETYGYAQMTGTFSFPSTSGGVAQTITFDPISDITAGTTQSITLNATSSQGLPVDYMVMQGPAEIVGNTLRLTNIPARSKFPIKVTVVATQYGCTSGTLVKTATPVERTFYIQKGSINDVRNASIAPVSSNLILDWTAPATDYSANPNGNDGLVKIYEGANLLGTYSRGTTTATISGLSAGIHTLTVKVVENGVESVGGQLTADTNDLSLVLGNPILMDSSSNVLSNISGANSQTMKIQFRLSNNKPTSGQKLKVLVARYSASGKLLEVNEALDVVLNTGESNFYTISDIDTQGISTIKLYVWEDYSNIKPLTSNARIN
jgi:hypothetical protein